MSYPSALALIACAFAYATPQVIGLKMEKVADGVYVAVRDLDPALPSDGNTTVIVNDNGVMVVDTNITPASSRAVIAEIRKLTSKPVRLVINTHSHSDHTNGNGAYRDAFPGVEFIGHTGMREEFLRLNLPGSKEFIESSRKMLADAPAQLKAGKNADGTVMTERQRLALEQDVAMLKVYLPEIEGAPLIPPTIAVGDQTILHRGGREIRLLFLGRGNTNGDLVVYLPKEKIVVAGDLLVHPIPFSFDSYPVEWAATMAKMAALEADVVVPGHGPVFRDKAYLTLVTQLLDAVVAETKAAIAKGQSVAEAKKSITMDAFRTKFAGDDQLLGNAFARGTVPMMIEQAYRDLTAKK